MYIALDTETRTLIGQGQNRAALAVQHPEASVYACTPNAEQHLSAGGTVADLHLDVHGRYAAPLDRVEAALGSLPDDLQVVVGYALCRAVRAVDDCTDGGVPQHHVNALAADDSPSTEDVLDALRRVLNLPRKFGPIEALKTALSQ
jgi:hypothetical protein